VENEGESESAKGRDWTGIHHERFAEEVEMGEGVEDDP